MASCAITSSNYLGNPTNPNALVAIVGTVGSVYVEIVVFKSALDQAFAAGGLGAIENYLSPLMLAASTATYMCEGAGNLTMNSTSAIPAPSSAFGTYPNSPSNWSA